ncbi:hypothetical protein IH992_24460 [Candidatus Poribacteria bacterium]|nr:hypothetical protein [Candidatus Poribacteria bacterium]
MFHFRTSITKAVTARSLDGKIVPYLSCADELLPVFTGVLKANSWQEREEYMTTAYQFVARRHNDLGITDFLPTQVSQPSTTLALSGSSTLIGLSMLSVRRSRARKLAHCPITWARLASLLTPPMH